MITLTYTVRVARVAETEVDSEVAEHQTITQRAGFAERVYGGHARRLGGVVLGDARRPTV